MKSNKKKYARITLEELDRYGWETANMQNISQKKEYAAKSPAVALLRLVAPLLDALNPEKNA